MALSPLTPRGEGCRFHSLPANFAAQWFLLGTKGRIVLSFLGGATSLLADRRLREGAMSLGLILIIIVIIYLLGGFSGRFGGYGYGMGHSGMGLGGVILVVLLVLLLLHKL
jgi:Protein of unknown function (DUF3309)